MDFFGILFDIKNGKKVPYSKTYFDTLFAAKLAEMQIKTLTGTLPLTFTTSETALRSWSIYGNNTPHNYSAEGTLPLTFTSHTAGNASDWEIRGNAQGVGQRTVNLFDVSKVVDRVASGITYLQVENGAIRVTTGTTSNNTPDGKPSTMRDLIGSDVIAETPYILKATSTGSDKYIYLIGSNIQWAFGTSKTFSTQADIDSMLDSTIRWYASGTNTSAVISNIMLTKGSTAPSTYVPCGYEIPISVNGTPQTFYIGNAPLTEGQSISKTSTGVDIAAMAGSNTITTSLYNKPEMSITGLDYVGVGEPINDGWQIPLTVSDGTNTATVNVPTEAPLTEGQSVTDTLTISTFEGENTISTTLTNKPNMSITYKGG